MSVRSILMAKNVVYTHSFIVFWQEKDVIAGVILLQQFGNGLGAFSRLIWNMEYSRRIDRVETKLRKKIEVFSD